MERNKDGQETWMQGSIACKSGLSLRLQLLSSHFLLNPLQSGVCSQCSTQKLLSRPPRAFMSLNSIVKAWVDFFLTSWSTWHSRSTLHVFFWKHLSWFQEYHSMTTFTQSSSQVSPHHPNHETSTFPGSLPELLYLCSILGQPHPTLWFYTC